MFMELLILGIVVALGESTRRKLKQIKSDKIFFAGEGLSKKVRKVVLGNRGSQ